MPDTATRSGAEPIWGRLVRKDTALRANSTVATIRAQFLPLPLAHAISSQRPTPTRPKTRLMTTAKVTKPSIWSGVMAFGWPAMASSICERMPSVLMGVRIMLTTLSAAPAYISFTALLTDWGRATLPGAGGVIPGIGPAGAPGMGMPG